jgi:hypothetical protein
MRSIGKELRVARLPSYNDQMRKRVLFENVIVIQRRNHSAME